MAQNRAKAFHVFDRVLVRFAVSATQPSAWEELCLLDALVELTSGNFQMANAKIAAAQRPPTAAKLATIRRRELLTRQEIRDRFEELRAARYPEVEGPATVQREVG